MTTSETKPSAGQPSLPAGMERDENGIIRWVYVQNMWTHTEILYTVLLLFGAIFGIMCLITIISEENKLKTFLVFLAVYAVMAVVSLISWAILCVLHHGRQYLLFTMTETTVTYDLLPESQEIADAIGSAGMLAGAWNLSLAAAGMAASNQNFESRFERVKNVKAVPRHDLIRVNGLFVKNTVYCSPEQYEFVWNWITSRCTSAKIVRKRTAGPAKTDLS